MIALRLLEAVSQPCIKDSTTVDIEALHYGFAVTGTIIQEAGWRSVKGDFAQDDEPAILELPSFHIGDVLKIRSLHLLKKGTKPLPLYTEAGLLSAMENAGNTIDSKEERQAILNLGIGTPATRAAIIETLFSRSYIRRDKKVLVPTEKGLQVYELVKDKKISDVAMTAAWEVALQKIENNEGSADTFQDDIETYAGSITSELLQAIVAKTQDSKMECPKCKAKHLIIRDNLVKCPGESCGWVQFRNVCGVTIGLADIEQLVTKGSTQLLKGMKSKSGKSFDAFIVLTENGKTAFKFGNNKSA
jgi:DNA topoisomerase-3